MSADKRATRPEKKSRRGRILFAAALVLLPVLPVPKDSTMATVEFLVWLAAVLYLILVMMRAVLGPVAKRQQAKAEAAPVAWLLGRPSSSPSRAEATRNLPEYSARLLAARR